MVDFAYRLLFRLVKPAIATVIFLYFALIFFVKMVFIIAVVSAPFGFVLYESKHESPFFIFYLIGACVWPAIYFAIVLFFFRKNKNSLANRFNNSSLTPSDDDADNFLYGSNQHLYSPQAIVNAEISYTTEHLEKYGSID